MRLSLVVIVSFLSIFIGTSEARQLPVGTSVGSTASGQPDQFCVGGTPSGVLTAGGNTSEVCIDFVGSLIPTTSGYFQTLGSTASHWMNVETSSINAGGRPTLFGIGALNIPLANGVAHTEGSTGTANVSGSTRTANGTAASSLQLKGLFSLPSIQIGTSAQTNYGLHGTSVIFAGSSYQTLLSSGNEIILTSLPHIATTTIVGGVIGIPDGSIMILGSTSALSTVILQSSGTLPGSRLNLHAPTRKIDSTKTLGLIFNSVLSSWIELFYAE